MYLSPAIARRGRSCKLRLEGVGCNGCHLRNRFFMLGWAQYGIQPNLGTSRSCFETPSWRWFGCAMAAHENLAGGLIGGGALFAAWLAAAVFVFSFNETEREMSSDPLPFGSRRSTLSPERSARSTDMPNVSILRSRRHRKQHQSVAANERWKRATSAAGCRCDRSAEYRTSAVKDSMRSQDCASRFFVPTLAKRHMPPN